MSLSQKGIESLHGNHGLWYVFPSIDQKYLETQFQQEPRKAAEQPWSVDLESPVI
jgi:hypothetical protein